LFRGTNNSAFSGSRVPSDTIDAYLGTQYRIHGDTPFVLRIGQRSEELATLFQERDVSSAAVLTAWNPYSEFKTKAENEVEQGNLISALDRLALPHHPGHGADPTGEWPPEPSQLVLGVDLEVAIDLGNQFRQNGIVWIGTDVIPTLILLC